MESELSYAARVAVLAKENQRLRYRQLQEAEGRAAARWRLRMEQAHEDAVLLVSCAVATLPTCRSLAPLSERRWVMALALLRLAGLVEGRSTIRIGNPARAAAKLALARDRAITHPELLRLHLPQSRR